MADEEAQTNGETGLDLLQARQVLLANSAKQRVAELNDIHERLTRQDIPLAQILPFLNILFDIYPLYVDDRSRHAVESCLTTIASLPTASAHTTKFAEVLEKESTKVGIAPGNAFVLIRWSSLLIQVSAEKKEFWESWGARSISTLSNASVILYSSEPKDSTRSTALRVSRRAFRTLVKAPFGADAIGDVIESLTKKAAGPCPRNAIPLGIIAGVCSRVSGKAAVVEEKKSDYIAFYLREILGSRTPLPAHIADGLKDFFASYVSVADLSQEIIPSVEKALLRSPEIVLNDLVSPLFAALPDSVDLSGILANNLLKPLLANTKSSNASTREGAVRTFRLLATRSYDDALIEKAADEILGPLKGNKITAADQRLLQAEMLSAFKPSAPLATKILQGLNALSLKETNEPAASALLSTLGTYLQYALQNDVKVEAATIDTFAKGVADKRAPMRRIWALQFAECLWQLKEKDLSNGSLAIITDACIGKLVESFNDAVANPIPALQAGQVPIACATSALCISRLASIPDLKNSAAIKKAGLLEKALTIEPKPSFLLNPRIYTKLASADDLTWLLRALTSTFPGLPKDSKAASSVAWAQAMIFLLVSSSVPPKVRREATTALSLLYHASRSQVSSVVIAGLWQWCEDVELEAKESAALASKTGREELYKVIRAICSDPPSEATPAVDPQSLEEQYRSLHILCRSQLIPKAPWIELARRIWNDLSVIVKTGAQDYLSRIIFVTENPAWKELSSFHDAAHAAAAELVFVAPSIMTPLVVAQITSDLDAKQLDDIGPTEAAIYRTPEGTAFIDVLSKQSQTQQISKTDKDYDLLKWEEELRAQIAQKKGQAKKLTPEEQSKVKAQLAKEAAIRQQVAELEARLRRGIGIIVCLTKGPVIEGGDGPWFGPSVKLLFDVVEAGAGLILGNAPALGYLKCSEKTDGILGSLRPFVGVATLRAAGITILPENLLAEPLGDLITRVMYRLRFLGERKPFDPVTLSYILALVFLVLESGGIDREASEEADEQIVLAIEFLSFHTRTCTDTKLPRQKLFTTLIASMQRYTQHFRPCRDCFSDLCENISENINEVETDTVVKGSIVPDISVRNAVLQAISDHLFLSDREFYEEIWLASYDDDEQNASIAQEIWAEHKLVIVKSAAIQCLPYLQSKDSQLRRAAARAVAAAVQQHPETFTEVRLKLEENYVEFARARKQRLDRYGMPIKQDLADPWEARHGFALAFKELAPIFPSEQLIEFMGFLVEKGPLSDKSTSVRDAMVDAATTIVALRGMTQVEPLMKSYETTLQASSSSQQAQEDLVNEAVVILYGALARHLPKGDARMAKVVNRLLSTLSTPSESVQYAVAMCLPPLVKASSDQANEYLQQMVEEMLHAKKYAARRGAAYGLAGIVKGKGISLLKDSRLLSTLRSAADNKKDPNERQGAFLAFELLSLMLVRIFEPYVIQIVPQLLAGFADTSADVRMACLDAAKTCFSSLSSYGVKQVLPILLEGLDDQQWRSKKGACDSLGAMAYLDPQQLAISLPAIIPPLTEVLNDSHKEVRGSANKSLQRFGEVISNPEVKSQVGIVLKALSDPTKYTDDALDALIKVNFIHYLDAPSLALVVRILERGLGDRSATKRKAAQIIGSLAHLTERKDLIAHLPILVAGLRVAIVDPVPTTRATASKALGSTIEKLGEDALPDLIPSLMSTLKSDTGAGDRLGSAQALSEVLAGLGTGRLEETLPTILQNVSSSKASVREGFMSLFIFLPACFGNSFANYLSKIIPPILSGLADDVESIRETALRAGRLLVKNFAARSVDLLLPELERGLADDNYRIRLSSVELVGDLLFNLTGISGKAEAEDMEEGANEAGQSLLEVIGEEKRNRVLSALYICRCDTSGLVRTSALGVWKALVSSPRTLRELIPTLTQLLIRRLASSNMEQKVIAGNALGELIRKAGEGVLATLLPTLEEGLQTSTDTDARQGICIALRELITSAAPEALEDYEKTLMSVVRTALVDSDEDVREEAAEAFDSLQKIFGKRAVDQVLPYLLSLLRSEDDAEHALSALLTLLTDSTRSNIILPNLLPTLIAKPITAFNARALASLAEVASSSMTRRLNVIINALIDGALETKDESLHTELTTAVDTIILSVDEYDGLNTLMTGVMLPLAKHDDHRKREIADLHLAKFFEATEVDFSRYYPDLIRALLIAFDDSAAEVVKAAWTAMNALTQQLRKEEMESLVTTTRTTLNQVGVAGHNLPGFSLPKGINAILPIFLQGLMNGSAEQRTQAALAISDLIDRTSPEGLKPFVTQITGPLIRVVSERSTDLKAAILLTLNNLLEKIPTFLKPFLPQLQRTFAKSLADPTSEVLRSRAAKALGTLITMTPRVDPLIAELVTGSKTTDSGVRTAMLKALYEVVSKAGANMNEVSRNSILGLIDSESGEGDDALNITFAKLLGALIKVLPAEPAASLIKSRVLLNTSSNSSVLALNAVLAEAPEALIDPFEEQTRTVIAQGINSNQPFIADNSILAAGKYLLTESSDKSYAPTKPILEALAGTLPVGKPVDARRLTLVVLRTVSREHNDLIRSHLPTLVQPVFRCVRDPVIPIKLSAEAAFLAMFSVVEEESAVFDNYMSGPGASLPPAEKRSMQEYFKRIALRLSSQARERKEAEGGQGGLGLSSDEVDDEREVWSIGRVDLGEGAFGDD